MRSRLSGIGYGFRGNWSESAVRLPVISTKSKILEILFLTAERRIRQNWAQCGLGKKMIFGTAMKEVWDAAFL